MARKDVDSVVACRHQCAFGQPSECHDMNLHGNVKFRAKAALTPRTDETP